MVFQGGKLGKLVGYVLVKRNKSESKETAMRIFRHLSCQIVMILSCMCLSGEILYKDYIGESELLSSQDYGADAWIPTLFDWNYFFKSNSLAVALKIKYGEGTNAVFRPIVVRYDFNGVYEQVGKTICRADTCYRNSTIPTGFCMVGLDSFLFSHGQRECQKTAFMCISDSTQTVVDITRDVNGMPLRGALSASERAVFPNGGGYAFQCAIGKTNNWGLLLWNKGVGTLWPVASRLKGYTCLDSGRVLFDVVDTHNVRTVYSLLSSPRTEQDVQVTTNAWVTKSREYWKLNARCCQVLPRCDANIAQNAYADWDVALSNKIISLGKDVMGGYDWSIDLHDMKESASDNELGHDFVEGHGVLYDFFKWKIFRIRKNDSEWQSFDLKKFFSEDIAHAKDYVPMAVLHRGLDAWYYALLFEYEKLAGDSKQRYRIRIVEVPHKGEKYFLWSFPDFNVTKKLTTIQIRSPGVVHKLQDDSWVFLSNTCTFSYDDAIFVQRMTGSRKEIRPVFKEITRLVFE